MLRTPCLPAAVTTDCATYKLNLHIHEKNFSLYRTMRDGMNPFFHHTSLGKTLAHPATKTADCATYL
jgi:hypothetical protein